MKIRKCFFILHLWLGFLSGLIIVIMGITGCLLSFENELKQLLYPQRFVVRVEKNEKLSLNYLKTKAENALPGTLKVNSVTLFSDPKSAYVFSALKMNHHAGTFWGTYPYFYKVYLNPYTGEVIELVNAKRDFFELVLNLHKRLLLGEKIGRYLTGNVIILFILILVSGLVIWYPRKMSKKMLKGMFLIKMTVNWKRLNYDLHNVLGFYAALPLLLISYSALIWSFNDVDLFVQKLLNGNPNKEEKGPCRTLFTQHLKSETVLNLVGAHIEKCLLGKKKAVISFPEMKADVYKAKVFYGTRMYQNDQYHFASFSGKLIKFKSFKNSNIGVGTALRERNYDIHTGTIFGKAGQFLYFLAAMIAASLPVTGWMMWFNKKRKIKKNIALVIQNAYQY